MSNVIKLPVTSFTSHEKLAKELNRIISDEKVSAVFFNKISFTKGSYEIHLIPKSEANLKELVFQQVERPSKFKEDATSQYYCVYYDKSKGKYRYKFVRKGKPFNSKSFDTELDAALAYDEHVYRVDGSTRKLNFPEKVFK